MRIQILLVQTFLSLVCVTMALAQMAPFSARDPRYLLQPSDVLEIHYRYSPEFDQRRPFSRTVSWVFPWWVT